MVMGQAGRRDDGGWIVGTGREAVRKDVGKMISSWEQLNDGGGEEALNLEIPTEYESGARRTSQDFRDLCRKFDGREEEGVVKEAKQKSGRDPSCSFSNMVVTSPGPISGRGARRKCIQPKPSFDNRVVRGDSGLVRPSTNRGLQIDRGEAVCAKKMKVLKKPDG